MLSDYRPNPSLARQLNLAVQELPELTRVEIEDLPKMGFIRITEIGEENFYFVKDNKQYYCKP